MVFKDLCKWVLVAALSSLVLAEPKEFRDFSVDGVQLKQKAQAVVPSLKARKYKPVKELGGITVWELPRRTGYVQIQWDEVWSITGKTLAVEGRPFTPNDVTRASLKAALERWGVSCYFECGRAGVGERV